MDAISDAELIEVINGIKANINQIESFAMEFNYLDLLLTSVESANTAEIGAKFDELVVSNSKLIKKDPNLNSLVAYFFDDYVTEKLNPTDDVDLITIVNKIKANISQIVSFELEFSNLDLLFDAVNNNNLNSVGAIFDQIIASNSRLIRKNPNIKDIISYFLDDYIQTNISSSQQGLVGIISGIKANILNVENFETEFGYLEELLNVVKTSNKTQIGAYLDDLIENDSKLINRSTIDSLVRYYFETYVSDELDPTNDAVLIRIVNEIKDQNISSIESFEKEFTNLELLFTNVNGADLNSIGSVLDQIIANNSKLIKRDPNINKLVSYFFDQYVLTNFDQTEDSNLILAVNGMKNNISSVESFATEINYISTLLDKVKTSTKKQIGAYLDSLVANNSKLIKKDPNMFDLVSCLFDDYVSESLNASTDAKIIEIINGIKNNISSINSFELEFENLDLLLVNVNSSSKQYVGEVFDTIVVSNSNLIQSKNLNDLVKLFFDEYVEDSLDETEDAELITIVNNIKNNVNLIESYKQEFVNLDSLFTTLSNLNPSTIGEELDELKINSKLISLQNIQQITLYFFDNNTEEYKTDYNSTILLMRAKVAEATEFKNTFAELSAITTNLTALTNLNSMESFIYSSDVGLKLDEMAAMTYVCDKQIAYTIANTVITKFLNYVNDGYSQVAKDQMVVIMNNEVFSFNTYNPADSIDYVGSHADENYYTDLINAMIDSLDGSY